MFARIATGIALDPREAADERLAVERLELGEPRAVDDPRDQLVRVHLVLEVLGHEPVEVVRVERRRLGRRDVPRKLLAPVQVADDLAGERERVLVGGRVVVGDSRAARVDVGAAELLRGHVLAGRRLHERRAADEDRPGALHDHGLVAHRRHVGAAGRARAHHDGDLRDALRGHARLVVEDPAEVLPVGEDLGLERQERAAGVDEVDARQVVLLGDLLRAQVLLDGQREVRAALHGRVVRDDDALLALDHADARDDPGRGRGAVVQIPGGERVQLEERRTGSTSRSIRSRAVSLPRDRWRSTAFSPPPRATSAVRSRSSATSDSIRSARRAKVSSRSTCEVRSAMERA